MPEFDAGLLVAATATVFTGAAYRNQAPGFDPVSGEGARRFGGRFNPPHSFPVVYLCAATPCVVAELTAQAIRQGLRVPELLPRELWAIPLSLSLETSDLVRPDHGFTRQIDDLAHDLRQQAVRSPSGTDVDEILPVFPENRGSATMTPRLVKVWTDVGDLPT